MDFSPSDLLLIPFLAFLEGLLSIDNAIVLAMMVKPLPKHLQRKALTYGLVGAVVFRLAVLSVATHLIHWTWVKILGGGYLIGLAVHHGMTGSREDQKKPRAEAGFWSTVIMIELMDIAFAVDSVLAAVALTSKLWIVFTGGMLGVIMMRFAASWFVTILKRFPKFENTAYELVFLIGVKLCVDAFHLPGVHFESPASPAFWLFWGLMTLLILRGFGFGLKRRPRA